MRPPLLDPGGGVLFLIGRGKINLAASEKVRIFAPDFIRKSSKRYASVCLWKPEKLPKMTNPV